MKEPWRPLARSGRHLWRAAGNFSADGAFNDCAAVSYYALLSVVPFLTLIASALGLVLGSSDEALQRVIYIARLAVPELSDEIVSWLEGLIDHSRLVGAVSLVATVWTSSLVFASLQRASDRIFRVSPRALWGTIKPRLIFLGAVTLLVLGFVLHNVLTFVHAPNVYRYLGGGLIDTLVRVAWVQTLAAAAVEVVLFGILLAAIAPGRSRWSVLLPAAAMATGGWEVGKHLFALYLRRLSDSATFTGSAAAALVFMLWVYFAAMVTIYSIELLAVLRGFRSPDGGGRTAESAEAERREGR